MTHKIIALWCHPRSMSTAMERSMRERGDLTCFHEPFMYYYYLHLKRRKMPHFEADPGRPRSYEAIRKMLLDAAEAGPVFFKDMSYYVLPELMKDEEFTNRIIHSFLIRDPLFSLISFHTLDPDFTWEEAGLEAEWRHFDWLRRRLAITPPVIEAELVRSDPTGAICRYCDAVGLPFKKDALSWSGDRAPEDWNEVSGWHGDVSSTSGFRQVEADDLAAERRRKESYMKACPGLEACYRHHLPFYERLRGFSLLRD